MNIKCKKTRDTINLFFRFLKENGLYTYYTNIMKNKPRGEYIIIYNGDIETFFEKCPPRKWTTSCFSWSTYDIYGVVDWSCVHYLWAKLLEENEIQR
jgi:hypothetical protein